MNHKIQSTGDFSSERDGGAWKTGNVVRILQQDVASVRSLRCKSTEIQSLSAAGK